MSDDLVARLRADSYALPSCGDWIERNGDTPPNNSLSQAADLIEQQAARIKELEKDAAFRLEASSRETEEARFYRYLRDEAGQSPDDHDGPMICSGLGDNFDYLRGEECDKEIRAAIDAARDKADK